LGPLSNVSASPVAWRLKDPRIPGEYGEPGDMGPLGEPMKPLLVAMSSCAYGEDRSTRESTPLVAIEVRAL
jgi:hypothetical protein